MVKQSSVGWNGVGQSEGLDRHHGQAEQELAHAAIPPRQEQRPAEAVSRYPNLQVGLLAFVLGVPVQRSVAFGGPCPNPPGIVAASRKRRVVSKSIYQICLRMCHMFSRSGQTRSGSEWGAAASPSTAEQGATGHGV